jgi:glutaredoxin
MLCDILGGLTPPFFMEIKVYTIPGCRYCDQVKELFARADVEYEAVMLNTEELKEQFKSEHPNVTGFPHVIIDGEVIGGLVETARLFLQKGMVSSRKK